MEVRILGPLEVAVDGVAVPLGAPKQRALLALLALRANEAVSVDTIVEELWHGQAPPTAAKNVQVYVSHLRKVLGDDALETRPPGYALRLARHELDAWRAEDALQTHAGTPESRGSSLRAALALWRGAPLADLSNEPFAQLEVARLEELRLRLLEGRIEADLELGRHADVVGELERLIAVHPLRERLRSHLMLALYRSGRQADALAAYRDARASLAELGLEPAKELRELERRILTHDPTLAVGVTDEPGGGSDGETLGSRRRWVALAVAFAALLLLAGAAALAFAVIADETGPVPRNSVAVIDPRSDRVVDRIPVGNTPTRIVVGEGFVWALNSDDRTVSQIDPHRRTLVRTFGLDTVPTDLAAGAGALWIGSGDPVAVLRVDPASGTVVRRTVLWSSPIVDEGPTHTGYPPGVELAVAFGSVWAAAHVGYRDEFLARIDPSSGAVRARIPNVHPGRMAADPSSLYTIQVGDIARIDPGQNVIAWSEAFRWKQTSLAADDRWLWVAQGDGDVVWQLDGATRKIVRSIAVGHLPSGVATGFGSVWVSNADGTVSRVDLRTQEVVATVRVGGVPHDVAVGEGAVWVTTG
jgi:DNA-binding SARP family transcriptional activator/DNA-binding beta-propeller fold protein YncE